MCAEEHDGNVADKLTKSSIFHQRHAGAGIGNIDICARGKDGDALKPGFGG